MHSKNQTYAYAELIETYQAIASKSKYAQFSEFGKSDIGKPIHLVVIAKNGDFSPEKARKNRKSILLINNGIHAGEACGIDASVELVNKLTDPKHEFHGMLDSVVVLIIPVYNVGGMLNRGSFSRANQNGPEEHGFRGNAKNLDLNRDFIKLDSRNAKTFTKLFRAWDPDIFIDTHTTNGSDHQYTLTLINTQKDKLNPVLSQYAEQNMVPAFYQAMENKSMNIIPYVSNYKSSPDQGIKAFLETPRYSSGYTALFDCFSFITEAHVYKSFTQRVQHTLAFLETVITYSAENATALQKKRREAKEYTERQSKYTLEWELDTMTLEKISFSGYESVIRESELTEQEMMFYNREEPFSRKVPYYNSFKTKIQIEKPKFYIVPQAYERVIDRLLLNDVRIRVMEIDSLVSVYVYYIKDYVSPKTPYEGHFLHTNIEVEKRLQQVQLYKGDYWIEVNQESNRYIVETLEPQSVDGFFAWNFFDGIVQQKEWFSDYSFEPKAIQFLKDNPQVKEEFENKKATDRVFANNSWAQLYYIYKKSPYYEKTVNRYPVYRIE
tara:strand:+ start:62789 stop:64444 length:1656 start_codon:yes stop_codon:yes gene_type:complete